jgi:hypothetical protein
VDDTVTITGTGFATGDSVYFNGIAVINIVTVSATQLVVTVPTNATNGNIKVADKNSSATSSSAFTVNHSVYVSGYDGNAQGTHSAVYWKDGTEVVLSSSINAQLYPEADGIYVAPGGNVYTAGCQQPYPNSPGQRLATSWKNTTETPLVATPTDNYSQAYSVVVSDGDVYVAGWEDVNNISTPTYWKNGTAVRLPGGTSSNAVFISGADVYVAGFALASSGTNVPTYWKNGTAVTLPVRNSANGARARSVFVSGTDVYVSGYEGGDAVYWINGKETLLTNGSGDANATAESIVVSGTDVYAAGAEAGTPTLWKNGTATQLTSPSGGAAYSVFVSNGDVYVAGYGYGGIAEYWKNGTAVILSQNGASAQCIFVR